MPTPIDTTDESKLNTAVNKAFDQLEGTAKPESEKEEKPEVEVEIETETEAESEDELTEEQQAEAKQLYKALSNTKTAGPVVAALMHQFGIVAPGHVPETQKEVKQAKKDLKEIVTEALGPEYKFMADKIGTIFETVLAQERQTQAEQFQEIKAKEYEREVVSVFSQLSTETKGESKRLESRMAELGAEIPIGNMGVETYIRRLYTIASGEKKNPAKTTADRIKRNANDVPSRLRGTSAGGGSDPAIPDKKMSLNESVTFALNQLTQGKR